MNRRELLKAIAALPALKSIEVATLAPDDVIVITSEDYISNLGVDNIRESLQQVWPGRKVIVLQKGLSMRVVKG